MVPFRPDRETPTGLAFDAADPEERLDALQEYATRWPDGGDWRAFLRHELRGTQAAGRPGGLLNRLTLFPEEGWFARNEVLELTDDADPCVRDWALEVLVIWLRDSNLTPDDPQNWKARLPKRLADDCADFRVRESIQESAQYVLARLDYPGSSDRP